MLEGVRRGWSAAPWVRGGTVFGCMAVFGVGCVSIEPSFDSAEPAARNAAALEAVGKKDQRAVPELIGMLESDDPATRLIAVQSLERLTGERRGFEAYGTDRERAEAVARWVEWWNGEGRKIEEGLGSGGGAKR